jgi:hypothetical protein
LVATAIGTYATATNVQTRLGVTLSAGDLTLVGRYCDQVNSRIEGITRRVLAPITYTAALFDGNDSLENGRCIVIPRGLLTISLLRIALYTGGAFTAVPATDYFIQPNPQERDPGWPGTELWMSDVPTAANTVPYFASGFANIEITGTGGWAAMPDEIVDCAETVVIRAFQARRTGQSDAQGTDATGATIISRILASEWKQLLDRYTLKDVAIIG